MERPLKQKTIGILGGASNVATGYYYQFLNDMVNERLGGWEIAETVIAGMNFGNIEHYIRTDDWDGLEVYVASKVDQLEAANVDLIICVSNTLHRVLDTIMQKKPTPFMHIADPTAKAIQDRGLRKVALFGTKPVMNMDYLKDRYRSRSGIEVVAPSEAQQNEIDRIIFDELVKGQVLEASKRYYIDVAYEMKAKQGAEGLILGCTEIFTLIGQDDFNDLAIFDTTRLHCEAAVDFALN